MTTLPMPIIEAINFSKSAHGAVSLVNTTWPKCIEISNELMALCFEGKTGPYFTCNDHEIHFNVRNGYATYVRHINTERFYFKLVSGQML